MKAARGIAALVDENPLQALALLVGGNFAAHANVAHRGHEDQEASRQRDVAGDAGALLGDGLLGNLDQNLLSGLQQVADDGQVGGLHGPARRATAAAVALALACGRAAATASSAVARLLGRALAFDGCGLVRRVRLIFVLFVVECVFLVAILAFEFQLDFVVEMGLLQHFAQGAGANLVGQRLLFIVFKVVLIRLVTMVTRRVELLLFNHLFLDDAAAGRIGRDGGHRGCFCRGCLCRGRSRSRGGLFLLLLAAKTKQTEAARRQWVNAVRGGGIGSTRFRLVHFRFRGYRFVPEWAGGGSFEPRPGADSSCLMTASATGSSADGSSIAGSTSYSCASTELAEADFPSVAWTAAGSCANSVVSSKKSSSAGSGSSGSCLAK
jgi:hypothetical protein